MIPVTKPFLPDIQTYHDYVVEIFNRNWLTNNGPLLVKLEDELKKVLGVHSLKLVSNGTIALQFLIKAFGLKNEVLTTPFTYIATTSSLLWEHCKPIFVDIEPNTLNIDPNKIKNCITPQTSGILATHVFGNPVNIEQLEKISEEFGIPVIYDSSHAFGVTYKNQSILNYGDANAVSLHATKIYHTIEGGVITTQNPEYEKKIGYYRNFGHEGFEDYGDVGINGKMSEFHAAMGLSLLEFLPAIFEKRQIQYHLYTHLLKNSGLDFQEIRENTGYNYAYFPLIFKSEAQLLNVIQVLNNQNIFPRRYFYPSLNKISIVDAIDCPLSEDISRRVICLPLYHDLSMDEQKFIVKHIMETI